MSKDRIQSLLSHIRGAAVQTAIKLQNTVVDSYSFTQRQILNNSGTEIMNEDWDNLIILDACRYDIFEEINTIDGNLESRISRGSSTPEFLLNNFKGTSHYDTVYVCAIPMIEEQGVHENFYDTIRVWRSDWDDENQTVPPEDMADQVRDTANKYPEKRIIAHFLQPHYPFIGSTGKEIPHPSVEGPGLSSRNDDAPDYIWKQLREDRIDTQLAWEAYRENLELALPHVNNLINDLTGRTVVTSDHGNGFGKYGVYGHPTHRSLYLENLVKVPWLVIDDGTRKDIVEEDSYSGNGSDSENIQERLQALGYAE